MRHRIYAPAWLIVLLLLTWSSGIAQTESRLSHFSINLDNFPVITIHSQVFDAQGNFIPKLQRSDFHVEEDGIVLPGISLREFRPGAQLAIVLNPGDSFTARNSQGINRYQIVLEVLKGWIKSRQGSTNDDMSLFVQGGTQLLHKNDPAQILQGLENVVTSGEKFTPSPDPIFQAVETVVDTPPRPGMGKLVLLVTATIAEENQQSLENLAARAKEMGVRMVVWMVGSTQGPYVRKTEMLQSLAAASGGSFFNFTGEEVFPSLEDIVEPLRQAYELRYLSQIRSSGVHQLALQVQTAAGLLVSPVTSFEMQVLPPVPVFIMPPVEIQRNTLSIETDRPEQIPITAYQPTQQQIQILVEFPDGRKRPITRTTLFVDGTIASENIAPPFDQFTWNLSDYTTNGNHVLRVEAEDNLGLTGSSIEVNIMVTVVRPRVNPLGFITRNLTALTVVVIILAGAILFMVLVLGGWLKPSLPGRGRFKRVKQDPTTQPVLVQAELEEKKVKPKRPGRDKIPAWLKRLQRSPRSSIVSSHAYLTPIEENRANTTQAKKGTHAPPIPITTNEVIIGSDPALATILLTDPSVESRHARLVHLPDDSYRIFDEGSIAGTWVNYTQVKLEGYPLEHMDIIHVGRAMFRFTMRRPKKTRKTISVPVDQPEYGVPVSTPPPSEPIDQGKLP